MATRLYLPASGSSPLGALAIDAGWENSASIFFRAPTATEKANTALTDFSFYWPETAVIKDTCVGQWVSKPLAAAYTFATSETIGAVVRCKEANYAANAHLAYIARVVSGDGATVRGVLKSQTGFASEWSTMAATRIFSAAALAAVEAQAGDRIVIEVGATSWSGSNAYLLTMRYGDPTATDDFELTAALTTDLCPWVELSPTLSFSEEGAGAPADLFLDGVWG